MSSEIIAVMQKIGHVPDELVELKIFSGILMKKLPGFLMF